MSNQNEDDLNPLDPEVVWRKIKNVKLPFWLWMRWCGAIVAFTVYVGPYMQALAESAVVSIMHDNKDFREMQEAIGSIQTSINGINNTLTINAARAVDAEKDREKIERQVDRLVDFVINKKVELVPERDTP